MWANAGLWRGFLVGMTKCSLILFYSCDEVRSILPPRILHPFDRGTYLNSNSFRVCGNNFHGQTRSYRWQGCKQEDQR